jgi:hypothetical protein
MADVKISGLPAASAVSGTQELEVNESGTSKKVTGSQISAYVTSQLGTIATQNANNVTISGGSITGITDLAIADGGTGASTAQTAINNLLPSQTTNANKALVTDGTNTSWSSISLTTNVTGTLPVANGGTGAATLTANNVLLGNGTSAVQAVAPSTSGNVLTSNGTTWVSSPPTSGGGVTSINGQTGAVVDTNLYAIGSYIIGRPANTTAYGANTTIAGSSLYSASAGFFLASAATFIQFYPDQGDPFVYMGYRQIASNLVNVGTWRSLTPTNSESTTFGQLASNALWVRIS